MAIPGLVPGIIQAIWKTTVPALMVITIGDHKSRT
jgi:hypothetical protein